MDDKAFREILFLKPGQTSNPAEILKTYFNYDAKLSEYPSSILVLDFSNIYAIIALNPYWNKNKEVVYMAQPQGNTYDEVMKEISWNVRSRLTYIAMNGMYLLTVPADIITSPLQLILLLLGGGGVR